VIGETPNLAARLQTLATPSTVVISPGTRALARGRFEYEDVGVHALKGIAEMVRAWRVLSPSIAESRFEAAHRAELSPLVGREQEVELLLERWQQAKEGDGQVVLLSGEAGIGKSRIVETLRERTADDEPIRLRYQCSPYHMSSALHPFIDQLERAARFEARDTDESKLDKLESVLASGTSDVKAVAALLAPLLSLASAGRYPPLEMSPDRQKEQTLEALVAQLAGLSRTRPVLFTFEDAHWADPTSLELLELTVSMAQRLPVLVTITFRPEFPPLWRGYAHITSLTLNRFTRSLAAAMVENVTGGKSLPDNVLEQIIEKTDGVPLFVEELTKTILESGLLTEESGRYALSGSLSDVAIPATLHDSLMSRLDRLGAIKEVAQTASAIGREFDYDLLAAVSPLGFSELRDALGQLVDAELVFRHGRSQEDRYFFKHALVQDAAYESLLKRKRREIHARIADVLESRFHERAEREPELVARHFTEAGLAEQAVAYWRDAGKLSSSRSAYAEAVSHFTEGLEVLGDNSDDPGSPRMALEMQTGLADSLAWSKGFAAPEVEAAYTRALALCRRTGNVPELFGILWGLWHFFAISGNLDRALELARELRDLADSSDNPGRLSQAHRALGETLLWRGDFPEAREETDRGVGVYVAGPDNLVPGGEDPAVANRDMSSIALWCLGYPDQGLARATEALELSSSTDSAGDTAIALVFMGWVHLLRREPEAARRSAEQLLDFSTERGMIFFEAIATVNRGAALASLGCADEGTVEIARAMETNEAIGANVLKVWYLALLADAQLRARRPNDALASLDEAFRDVDQMNVRWVLADLRRLEATALVHKNDPNGAEASLDRAIGVAREQRAKSLELRACTDLARLWCGQGKHRRAGELILPVLDWFTEGFDAPDLVAARALVDGLS
jgi:tetratricopeptide (TPR) repeat protein